MRERKTRRENSKDRRALDFIKGNRIYHCLKLRYATSEQAWSAVGNAYLKGRSEQNVYPCLMCLGFHATSSKSAFVSANPNQWKPGSQSHNASTLTTGRSNRNE